MEKRCVGNRRSEEEIEQIKIDLNKSAFVLEEQLNFTGSEEQLEMMQNFERSYIDGMPLVSDEEWDVLKVKFHYTESLTSVSPSGRNWVKLFSPLPSLDKGGDLEAIVNFLNKFDDQEFICECKLDGLTANLRYKKEGEWYVLDCVMSKGNGRYGLQLHPYALAGVKVNYPDKIEAKIVHEILKTDAHEFFELRGEAVIKKNEHNIKKYGENAVLRSTAAGIFNRKVPFNLNGVICYIFEGKETLFSLTDNELGSFTFQGLENLANARLVASLINLEDQERFLRWDTLTLEKDGKIIITHKNGNTFEGYDTGEELDIVVFSASVGGSNIDESELLSISGVKYVSQIDWRDSEKDVLKEEEKVFKITSNKDEIMANIHSFYGMDHDTGKRDLKLKRLRNMYEYAIDGIVIKPVGSNIETQGMNYRNGKNNSNKIVCPKYPEDQIAVKLTSELVRVKLESITQSTTTLGNTTCCGTFDRPYLTESGAEVTNINLHNPEWLQLNDWIKEGEEYWMVMSMDVIPVLINPKLL